MEKYLQYMWSNEPKSKPLILFFRAAFSHSTPAQRLSNFLPTTWQTLGFQTELFIWQALHTGIQTAQNTPTKISSQESEALGSGVSRCLDCGGVLFPLQR